MQNGLILFRTELDTKISLISMKYIFQRPLNNHLEAISWCVVREERYTWLLRVHHSSCSYKQKIVKVPNIFDLFLFLVQQQHSNWWIKLLICFLSAVAVFKSSKHHTIGYQIHLFCHFLFLLSGLWWIKSTLWHCCGSLSTHSVNDKLY